jgi:uncharacterized membrane protein (DUF4010 family)
MTLASGVIATTVLVLVEKSRLHELVGRLNDEEISAGARFGVMAVVILPLLPDASYGPFGAFQPRALWALVLLFAGISFAGYAVRRAIAGTQGDALAGLIGGLVSSTQVTLVHARTSRSEPQRAMSLACGAIAASTVLFVRTELAAAVLSPELALALLPYIVAGLVAGLMASAATLRRSSSRTEIPPPRNPLQLREALQMAVVFQLVIVLAHVMREWLGDTGLVISGAIAGVTDVMPRPSPWRGRSARGAWHRPPLPRPSPPAYSRIRCLAGLAVALGDRKFGLRPPPAPVWQRRSGHRRCVLVLAVTLRVPAER